MSKGAVERKKAAAKAERRAVAVAERQVRVDRALLVDAFAEALGDFVMAVCDDCGHEFVESSEFNEGAVLPCLLCGGLLARTSPRHDEMLAHAREQITLLGLALAA
jgi:ribosomal protein S27E